MARVRQFLRRLLTVVVVFVLGVAVLTAATPQGRAVVKTALYVPQVFPDIPVKPQPWVTREPVWQEVEFPTPDGNGVADLILPGGPGKHSAVLFFLGVVVDPPREDQRVVNLAEGLARSGMAVMIPWSDTQLQQRIVPQDIDDLVWAFQYLRAHDAVDPERVGVGGICTGASMVTVAAQDERIRDHVKFVNFFAGYYDAADFAKAIGSRSRFSDDYVVPWETDTLTYNVFRNQLLDGLTYPDDSQLLYRVFVKQEAVPAQELYALSTEGIAVYKLLNGTPFDQVDQLLAQLSPQTHQFFRLVSPSTNLDQLKARVLIMHDRADKLVPYEESRRFAEALADRGDTYHTEFSFFQSQIQLHEDDGGGVGALGFAREALKLFVHMYNIMLEVS